MSDYRVEIEEVSAAAGNQGARVRLGLRLVGDPEEIVDELWRIRQGLIQRYRLGDEGDVPVGEGELRSSELRSEPRNCDLNRETAI